MNYKLTTPCDQCPFLKKMRRSKRHPHGFTKDRLEEFASGEFHCHKTGVEDEETGDYVPNENSSHCAGALIYLERRDEPNQMMRIAERIGLYDRRKLNMKAPV